MRIPFIPTLIVAAAVAVMIGLGIWQLQRAEWKAQLIAELEASDHHRKTSLACSIHAKPEVRAGRSAGGETGYRYLVPCGGSGTWVDIGWSKQPNEIAEVRESRSFTGVLAPASEGGRRILVLVAPLPPLQPSGLASPADLPNNHLMYAVQWFFFAGAAALIYLLALRRRSRPSD